MLFVFKFIITLDDFFFYVYHKIFYTIEEIKVIEKYYGNPLVTSDGNKAITELFERTALEYSIDIMKKSRYCKERNNWYSLYYIMR